MGSLVATDDQPDQLPSYELPSGSNPTFVGGVVVPEGPLCAASELLWPVCETPESPTD